MTTTTPQTFAPNTRVLIKSGATYQNSGEAVPVDPSMIGKIGVVNGQYPDGDLYITGPGFSGFVRPDHLRRLASVGDRVRVLASETYPHLIGRVGTIASINSEEGTAHVRADDGQDYIGLIPLADLAVVDETVAEESAAAGAETPPEPLLAEERHVYVRIDQDAADGEPERLLSSRVIAVGIGEGTWVQAVGDEVERPSQASLPADGWRLHSTMSAEQYATFLGNLAKAAHRHRQASDALRDRIAEMEAWRDRLVMDAHHEADRRGWCDEFDDFMEEHGLPRRESDYAVTVEVTVQVRVPVRATSKDDALEQADLADEETVRDFIVNDGRYIQIGSWSAVEAERD